MVEDRTTISSYVHSIIGIIFSIISVIVGVKYLYSTDYTSWIPGLVVLGLGLTLIFTVSHKKINKLLNKELEASDFSSGGEILLGGILVYLGYRLLRYGTLPPATMSSMYLLIAAGVVIFISSVGELITSLMD